MCHRNKKIVVSFMGDISRFNRSSLTHTHIDTSFFSATVCRTTLLSTTSQKKSYARSYLHLSELSVVRFVRDDVTVVVRGQVSIASSDYSSSAHFVLFREFDAYFLSAMSPVCLALLPLSQLILQRQWKTK